MTGRLWGEGTLISKSEWEKKNINNNSFVFMRGEFLYNFYHHSRAISLQFVYLRLFLSFERFDDDHQEEEVK